MRPSTAQKTRYPGVKKVDSDTYLVRVKVKDPRTGRPRQAEQLVKGAKSPAEAAAARQALRRELLAEDTTHVTRPRLADYASAWLSGKRRTLKASTLERYATTLDLHVIPALGDFYVDALTPADILHWRDGQDGAPNTINGRLRVLKTVLADATHELSLDRDPARRVKALPERAVYSDDDPNILDARSLRVVLDAAKEVCPTHYPVIAVLAFTGVRIGEALALRWDDVDEAGRVLHIRRSHHRGTVGTTKTGRSRSIPLDGDLAVILADHRRRARALREPGFDSGWVFPSANGTLRFPSTLRKPLQRACEAAGITWRFTPHGFRRSFNDMLRRVASGTVQRSLTGHSTERMSEHYSHVSMGEKRAAVSSLLRLVPPSNDGSADQSADLPGGQKQEGRLASS